MLFELVCAVLLLAAFLCLGLSVYNYLYAKVFIGQGAIVQKIFSGSPAYVMTALLGPRGELEGSVSSQDLRDTLRCDVPGSRGAYSSWFQPVIAVPSAYAATSYTTHLNVGYSCSQDSDCAAQPWMGCGASSPCYAPTNGAGNGSQVEWSLEWGTANCCNVPGSGVTNSECSLTGEGTESAICVATQDIYKCAAMSDGTGRCQRTGAPPYYSDTCSTWGAGECSANPIQGATNPTCNVLQGICVDDPPGSMIISPPWLAEGVVDSVNSDGSVNVDWQRVQLLYNRAGPVLPWFPSSDKSWSYPDCRFISDGSASSVDPHNAATAGLLFGDVSAGTDIWGLPDASAGGPWDSEWKGMVPNGFLGGLPSYLEATSAGFDSQTSAWNLTAFSVSTADLTRVPAFTINHNTTSQWDSTLMASMSVFGELYMADRPPHLQMAGSSLIYPGTSFPSTLSSWEEPTASITAAGAAAACATTSGCVGFMLTAGTAPGDWASGALLSSFLNGVVASAWDSYAYVPYKQQ